MDNLEMVQISYIDYLSSDICFHMPLFMGAKSLIQKEGRIGHEILALMYILVDIFLERGFDAVENSITKQAVVRVEDNKENKDEEQLYYLLQFQDQMDDLSLGQTMQLSAAAAALSVLRLGHPVDLETIEDNKAAPHLCFPYYQQI